MVIKVEFTIEEQLLLIRLLNKRIYTHLTENTPIHKKSFVKKYILAPISCVEKIASGNKKFTKWEQVILNSCINENFDTNQFEDERLVLRNCKLKMK